MARYCSSYRLLKGSIRTKFQHTSRAVSTDANLIKSRQTTIVLCNSSESIISEREVLSCQILPLLFPKENVLVRHNFLSLVYYYYSRFHRRKILTS